jgi:PAS domain S-box-containing protein
VAKVPDASGLFNLMRKLGGAIGWALTDTAIGTPADQLAFPPSAPINPTMLALIKPLIEKAAFTLAGLSGRPPACSICRNGLASSHVLATIGIAVNALTRRVGLSDQAARNQAYCATKGGTLHLVAVFGRRSTKGSPGRSTGECGLLRSFASRHAKHEWQDIYELRHDDLLLSLRPNTPGQELFRPAIAGVGIPVVIGDIIRNVASARSGSGQPRPTLVAMKFFQPVNCVATREFMLKKSLQPVVWKMEVMATMLIDLDTLFASAPSPHVLLDRDFRMVWANDAYLQVTARTRENLIGRLMFEEFPAPAGSVSAQMLGGSLRKVLETGKVDHLTLIPYPIAQPDNRVEERFWSATHTPILDAQGKVEFILQNTVDVTDLYRGDTAPGPNSFPHRSAVMQRAEAVATENLALGAMTDFFRLAFDQAPSFMAVLTGPNHVFQIANQSYSDLVGGRAVIGLAVRDALPELAGQGFYELLDKVFVTGEAVSVKGMRALLATKGGVLTAQHYIDFIYHPLKDEKGDVTGIFVQGHDVTGQKVAETTLTATREKFRVMAQIMPNHVWTASANGDLNWLNDRTYEFTGHDEGELFGTDWARVVHPEDIASAKTSWNIAIEQGVSYETEFRIRKHDGSYRWHLVRASPLRDDDGRLTGWVGTNTDIEDRKISEAAIANLNATLEERVAKRNRELEDLHATLRQSQKMEAIGELAGGIAHDFNNLLQIINGSLQLAARELPEASRARARIDQALKSSGRAATLASQLLSFARKQPLAPVVLNLGRHLGSITGILHSAVGEAVDVETSVEDGLWNTNVDPNNVENALLNLAINARDAMHGHGKLTVALSNARLDPARARDFADGTAGDYVMVSVTDTGDGMPPEVAERSFEPFFTTKTNGRGTGLGLPMVYGFAKQSGGHVSIDSEMGRGTTFRIYLPRSKAQAQQVQPIGKSDVTGGTETILLVEDDEDVRKTVCNMLTDLGYRIVQASNADEAMAILRGDEPFDLLFTDVVMPGKTTSRELAEHARQIRPSLPVLFTSGYARDTIVHGGRLDADVQLLPKPYTQAALATKVRDVLGRPVSTAPHSVTGQTPMPEHDTALTARSLAGLRILVCEDDVLIRMNIAEALREAGCEVFEAGTAAAALQTLQAESVAVLVTDVGLPDRTGEDLAFEARSKHPDLRVLFATGGMTVPSADALGNCKVLNKPFGEAELLDAIESLAFDN